MSLIEILFTYRNLIRKHNRRTADIWLADNELISSTLMSKIKASVSDNGEFIGGDGNIIR